MNIYIFGSPLYLYSLKEQANNIQYKYACNSSSLQKLYHWSHKGPRNNHKMWRKKSPFKSMRKRKREPENRNNRKAISLQKKRETTTWILHFQTSVNSFNFSMMYIKYIPIIFSYCVQPLKRILSEMRMNSLRVSSVRILVLRVCVSGESLISPPFPHEHHHHEQTSHSLHDFFV